MYKKLFLIVILIGLLSACGGKEESSNSSAVEFGTTQEVAPPTLSDLDQRGLDLLREKTNAFDNTPDKTVLDTAEAMCEAVDEGRSIEDVAFDASQNYGLDAGAFVAVAVQIRCMQHMPELKAWVANG